MQARQACAATVAIDAVYDRPRVAASALLRLWRIALPVVALAGCAAAPPAPPHPSQPLAQVDDESYDWRRLVTLPMGGRLQDLSGGRQLREVLVFQGETGGGDERECYALPDEPKRFIGRAATAYFSCFSHGRLERFQAEAPLTAAEGAEALRRFCDHWQAGATATGRDADHCRGRDGDLAFEATLGDADEDGGVPLSIVVYDAAAAEREQEKR